jgi:hypothetical protein
MESLFLRIIKLRVILAKGANMRFMVLVRPNSDNGFEEGKAPDKEMLERMGKFNDELTNAGVMLSAEGLHRSKEATIVQFSGNGKTTVTQGAFTNAKDKVCGFWIWKVKSAQEALEWAKKAPMEDGDILELREIMEAGDLEAEVEAQSKKQNRN